MIRPAHTLSPVSADAPRPTNMFQVMERCAVEGLAAERALSYTLATPEIQSPVRPAPAFKLVDEKTGEEVTLPVTGKCWDGHEITVREFKGGGVGGQGRILTTANEVYVPSVIGLKIVQVQS